MELDGRETTDAVGCGLVVSGDFAPKVEKCCLAKKDLEMTSANHLELFLWSELIIEKFREMKVKLHPHPKYFSISRRSSEGNSLDLIVFRSSEMET